MFSANDSARLLAIALIASGLSLLLPGGRGSHLPLLSSIELEVK